MIFGNIPPGYSTEPNPALGMNYLTVMPPEGQMYAYNQQTGEQITVPSGSFGQPPVFGPPGGQVPGGINYQNPFEFTEATNPYQDPLAPVTPFPTISPGANPFVPPTTNPYALPEQNPFPEVPTNPYLPPTPFQTIPVNTTPFENFSPISFDPTPELPVGTFNPYQTVFDTQPPPLTGGDTPVPLVDTFLSALSEGRYRYGDAGNAFRSGLLTEDEFRRFQNAFDAYTGTQVGARPFNIGDLATPASARSGTGDEIPPTTTTPAPPTTEPSTDPRAATGAYFVVDGKRYDTLAGARRAANAYGDSDGIEYYGPDGRLISGRPVLPPEELAALRQKREEDYARFQRQRDFGEKVKSDRANLMAQYSTPEYQRAVNQGDYYTIDRGNLRGMKFASFDDAKKFLEQYSVAGLEGVSDAYDYDQQRQARENLDINFASSTLTSGVGGLRDIRSSSGGKTMYVMPGTEGRAGTAFDNAEDAAAYLRPLIKEQRRAQAAGAIRGTYNKNLFNTYADTGEGFEELEKRLGTRQANYIKTLLDPNVVEEELSRAFASNESRVGVGPIRFTKRQMADGGEVSLKVSDIKRYRLGGPVGTFVERR